MNLKEVREQYGLSQREAAKIVGVPVRTFRRYEIDETYGDIFKRQKFIEILNEKLEITEEKGILSVEQIAETLTTLFDEEYTGKIVFCYLFGSYAKGYATEKSDVDLCVSTSLAGLDFVGLIEDIRNALHKKVDLIRFDTLTNNLEFISEILKEGRKIYG